MKPIRTTNPTGVYVIGPMGQLVTLPDGHPLKTGWRYASAEELIAAAAKAQAAKAAPAEPVAEPITSDDEVTHG